ncbi:MAG: homoserine dehydrogenase [Proteobacteria bacterium]|nr:homoserine dehydrogenase [Pseudomonadota bacterium]
METINIGIIGFGTVGTGVAKILLSNSHLIEKRIGVRLHLKYIADIDLITDRGVNLNDGVLINDADTILNDPDIHIIVETVGGDTFAKNLLLKAIEKGKHIVTANKALLAKHGNMIFEQALNRKISIGYEASVGGCMPVIKTLRETLVGNKIQAMLGILNGTCNYILTKIAYEKSPFEAALEEAQKNGYAEADPTFDVEGIDTAHKLAILISIAYGMKINFNDIYVEGISNITPLDIEIAEQFGYRIKLLAISKYNGNAVEARVHPTMIPMSNLLSGVNGSLNAIAIQGDAVGNMALYGYGAGMMPTASAIISDIADIARDMISGAKIRVPALGFQNEHIKEIPVLPIDEVNTQYYIRFAAIDKPGVLSSISGILGNHHISIKSVHQKGQNQQGAVPVVMMTYRAKESNIQAALKEITALHIIERDPMLIRIEDNNQTI